MAYIDKQSEEYKIFEETNGGISNRAAWALSYLVIEMPELIHPFFSKTISLLKTHGFHPAIYRNILRFLKEIKIPEKYQGKVYDACIDFFINTSNSIAVRAFSLYVIRKIAKQHPELKKELKIILEAQKEFDDNPAVKNVINKILPSLNKD